MNKVPVCLNWALQINNQLYRQCSKMNVHKSFNKKNRQPGAHGWDTVAEPFITRTLLIELAQLHQPNGGVGGSTVSATFHKTTTT